MQNEYIEKDKKNIFNTEADNNIVKINIPILFYNFIFLFINIIKRYQILFLILDFLP